MACCNRVRTNIETFYIAPSSFASNIVFIYLCFLLFIFAEKTVAVLLVVSDTMVRGCRLAYPSKEEIFSMNMILRSFPPTESSS